MNDQTILNYSIEITQVSRQLFSARVSLSRWDKMSILRAGQDLPDYRNDYIANTFSFYHLAKRKLTKLYAEIPSLIIPFVTF